MGSSGQIKVPETVTQRTFFYGWVIVAACTIIQLIQFGIQYSFGVFFKPLIADFGWSRAATSGAFSLLMLCAGIAAIPSGWLADRLGPARVMAACGIIIGLALGLASQVRELWQLYLVFGGLLGIALGGTMAITGGLTARWFFKRRGLALGIVSSGIGLGTLIIPPVAERLISTFGWSTAYWVIGSAGGIITLACALFLRRDPASIGLKPYGAEGPSRQPGGRVNNSPSYVPPRSLTLRDAIRTRVLWIVALFYFSVNICVQVVLVHLVNYATDQGISTLTAATLISMIGIGGIIGRLTMGGVSDKIGTYNSLIIMCLLLMVSLVWLIFSREVWMLYVFAIFFGFAYGGEVPQMPLLIGNLFGLQAVMALTGATSAATRAGGALGSWAAGKIFDVSNSYLIAFILTAVIAFGTLVISLFLKRMRERN